MAPDEELHRFHTQQARETSAHLYGRRLYETMFPWETWADERRSAPKYELEFARIWKDTPKIVFPKTLEKVEGKARLVRDSAAEEVARLKEHPGRRHAVLPGPGRADRPWSSSRHTRMFGCRVVYVRYQRAEAGR